MECINGKFTNYSVKHDDSQQRIDAIMMVSCKSCPGTYMNCLPNGVGS